jgi:hypothetical protein
MINPSTIDFTYKKFGTIPPAVVVFHDFDEEVITTASSDFLEIYDVTLNSFKLRLKATGADALAVGVNTVSEDIFYYNDVLDINKRLATLTLNITITDTVLLSVSPDNVAFTFQSGGATPANKIISVSAEEDWTVTKTAAWLSLSAASGTSSGSFEVGVISTGLITGVYTDTITVATEVETVTISVTFTVTDANTSTNYLYLNPTSLKFGFTVGGTIPPAKNIELNSSDTFTASVNVPWLELPTTTGAAGAEIIQLTVKSGAELDALLEGSNYAVVTITVASIVKTIDVSLEIYDFTAETPSNTDLLFTDDTNTLSLKSSRLDTFMQVNFTAIYNTVLYNFTVQTPFFMGGSSRNLGVIPKRILGSQNIIGLAELNIFQPYLPVVLNLELHEKELFTEAIVASSAVNNLKFIKGVAPADSFLSEIADTMFLTTKATLCFSVLSENVSDASIFITGAITKEIDVSDFIFTENDFYTVVLPIASLGEFLEGHEFTVSFLNKEITVNIIADAVDQTMVYWENNNGCFDALELTGEVTITPGMSRKTAQFRLSETTTINKTLSVTKPKSFSINTGVIHSNNQLKMIERMLYSKNIYIQTQGETVAVIPTTKKVPTYQTLATLKDFNINFSNAEE